MTSVDVLAPASAQAFDTIQGTIILTVVGLVGTGSYAGHTIFSGSAAAS